MLNRRFSLGEVEAFSVIGDCENQFAALVTNHHIKVAMAGLSSPVVPLEKGSMPRFSLTSKLGLVSNLEPSFSKNWLRGVAADADLSDKVTMSTCNPGV